MKKNRDLLFTILISFTVIVVSAQDKPEGASAEEMAKKLANPVASLISVPFQNNTDYGIGDNKASRNTLNFQPVIPIKLSPKINLITRYIVPVVTQSNITGIGATQSGLSDAVVSAFFSPTGGKLIWGFGPVFLLPIATNDYLASKKFGVGPTGLVLKQTGPWTIGVLANQIWSIAGDENRSDVNQLFVQPFVVHNWKSGAGVGLASEITQNYTANTTVAYLIPTISGVTKLGTQLVSLAVGPRFTVAAPDAARSEMGWRAVVVFVFPTK